VTTATGAIPISGSPQRLSPARSPLRRTADTAIAKLTDFFRTHLGKAMAGTRSEQGAQPTLA
jgi:hypothetical protein